MLGPIGPMAGAALKHPVRSALVVGAVSYGLMETQGSFPWVEEGMNPINTVRAYEPQEGSQADGVLSWVDGTWDGLFGNQVDEASLPPASADNMRRMVHSLREISPTVICPPPDAIDSADPWQVCLDVENASVPTEGPVSWIKMPLSLLTSDGRGSRIDEIESLDPAIACVNDPDPNGCQTTATILCQDSIEAGRRFAKEQIHGVYEAAGVTERIPLQLTFGGTPCDDVPPTQLPG
jgi:hypothetical protein